MVEDLTGGETVLLVDVMFGTGSVAAAVVWREWSLARQCAGQGPAKVQ